MKNATYDKNAVNDLLDIADVQPLTESDCQLVDEIFGVLKKYNAEKRFGLSLLHKHFEIGDDEVLVESVNIERKEQTVRPVKRYDLINLSFTETQWRLDSGEAVTSCVCVNMGNNGHSHQGRG